MQDWDAVTLQLLKTIFAYNMALIPSIECMSWTPHRDWIFPSSHAETFFKEICSDISAVYYEQFYLPVLEDV